MLPSSERGVLRLSLFDNGANQYHQVSNESRALILSLDTDFMIASLAAEFLPSTHAVSNSEGSMQVRPSLVLLSTLTVLRSYQTGTS